MVNLEVTRWELEVNRDGNCFMALCSIPMGWNSAVALSQYFHKRPCFGAKPVRYSMPSSWERRRGGANAQTPLSKVWVQFCLIDCDNPRKVDATAFETLRGMPSPIQQLQRVSYASSSIEWARRRTCWSR